MNIFKNYNRNVVTSIPARKSQSHAAKLQKSTGEKPGRQLSGLPGRPLGGAHCRNKNHRMKTLDLDILNVVRLS